MQYGAYFFEPVPFVNISQQRLKSPDDIDRGVTFSLSISGTLSETNESAGIKSLIDKSRLLRAAFDSDGKYFAIKCDEETLLECYPRVIDIQLSESPDNWVFTIPFTITIEYENDPAGQELLGEGEHNPSLHPPYISNFTEDWSIEFATDSNPHNFNGETNPYVLRVTHNLNAVGKSHYTGITGGGDPDLTGSLEKPAWQQAREYVVDYLGFDNSIFLGQYALNLPTGNIWSQHDHLRVLAVNESEGSYGVQESWLVLGNRETGASTPTTRKAIEDFTVDVQIGETQEYNTVAIQGTIRGLEDRTYGTGAGEFAVTGTKYANADSYFSGVSGTLYSRVNSVATLYGLDIHSTPLTRTIGRSPSQGLVSYNYTYDTRPDNCLTGLNSLGLKFENIQIADTHPTPIFAALTILGRDKGPILQDFYTVSEATRTVTVDVLVNPINVCTYEGLNDTSTLRLNIDTMISGLRDEWMNTYDRVFTTTNAENWTPKSGRYNRTVAWVGTRCTGT